jgi:hypothetical protein
VKQASTGRQQANPFPLRDYMNVATFIALVLGFKTPLFRLHYH